MENKKHTHIDEGIARKLAQVRFKLTDLENKRKDLLSSEEKEIKSEIESLMDRFREIIVDNTIKDKKETEDKIKISQKYLDKIIRECKKGIFVIDQEEIIRETNGRVETHLGYEREDFRGSMALKSLFPLADRMETFPEHHSTSKKNTFLHYERKKDHLPPAETSILDKNRKTIPFQVKATILKDTHARLTGAIFLLKDISKRAMVEDEIRRESEYLQELSKRSKRLAIVARIKKEVKENKFQAESIIESSSDGIIVMDISGYIKGVNQAFAKLLDYSPSELIGKHFIGLNPLEEKEYLTTYGTTINGEKYIKEFYERQADIFDKQDGSFETHVRRKDEVFVPVWCEIYWIHDKAGEKAEVIVFISDLTEKKVAEIGLTKTYHELQEAKEYLENIISTSPDGIIITDFQGMITMVNEAVEKMTGYTQEELKGMHSAELNPYLYDERYPQLRISKLFKDGRITGFEMLWKGKNGELISTEMNAALLKDKKGEFMGGVIVMRDIRERKKLEEMKNDFISSISHELRTPLTSIKGSIDNLLDGIAGEITDAQRDYLTIVNEESDRLVRLINDLLDLNKLEVRSIKLFPEELEYISLVSQVVFNSKELAYEKGLDLEVDWGKPEIYLKADSDKINQILINLISNAIKFTERGGIKVIVEDTGDQSIITRIRDTGIGIPKEDLDRIFDKFYQLHKPRTGKSKGTGLGLAITKQLVELHGGTIRVESEEGKGSEFCLTLPTGGS